MTAVANRVANVDTIELGRGDDGSGTLASGHIVFNHTDTDGTHTFGPGGRRPARSASIGPVAWGHVYGAWGKTDGDGNAAKRDRST